MPRHAQLHHQVARLHGRVDWEQDAANLLGQLGLYERADDLPVTFSRGLRQKTALAVGLIRPFELLLIDEPFVGLDASGKVALLELLDEARDKGAALVVATHELDFVQRVSRCVALRSRPSDVIPSAASESDHNLRRGNGEWMLAGPSGGAISAHRSSDSIR